MLNLSVNFEPDGFLKDVSKDKIRKIEPTKATVLVLDKGMSSGKPSVMMTFEMEDGTVEVVETSARLFVAASKMIHGRYPDLFED